MIRIGIVGYGNIGRGVREAVRQNEDMELVAIFTRRPEQVRKEVDDVPVQDYEDVFTLCPRNYIEVMILCSGSIKDIPVQGPALAKYYSTVDSFDVHAEIPAYFDEMNDVAKKNGHVCIISVGWDPGIFSMERILGAAILSGSKIYTFWGKGVSQGHSNAARGVEGVLDARAYTLPVDEAIQRVRAGETPDFSKKEMHRRLVYVVAEQGADKNRIEKEIVEMPGQFKEYDTEVVFIIKEQMEEFHSAYPHGGFVMISGNTGDGNKQMLEHRCNLESNPEFTASIMVACARAAYRISKNGHSGASTLLDIPIGLLSPDSGETLRNNFNMNRSNFI